MIEGWMTKRLCEICRIESGKAHEPFIHQYGEFICVTSKFISSEGSSYRKCYENLKPAKENDILMVLSDLPNGRALAKCLIVGQEDDGRFAVNQRIGHLKPTKIHPKFLYYLLNRNRYFLEFDDGVNQTNLSNKSIENCPLTFPSSLIEQQAISEALSDADALIASLGQLIDKKKCMLGSVKQQLLEVSGDNSERVVLGDIATFSKGRHLAKSQLSDSGKSPCVHYGELFTKYDAQISEVFSRTNLDEDTVLSKGGEVLMPTSDVTPSGLAKASYLTKPNVVIGGDILIIQPKAERLHGGFLSEVIRYLESQILSLVSGSTVYHIYAQDMAKFVFKLPKDVAAQKQIVEKISDFRNEIAALNEELNKARKVKAGMMQELLSGRTRLI